MIKKEIWKDIPGYEGLYQVSNIGRVKSLGRMVKHSSGGYRTVRERILKPNVDNHGYLQVGLSKNCKIKTIKIHQLVAIGFLNHKPSGYNIVVDHIDNNPLNNCVNNLQLITPRLNLSKDKCGVSKYTGVYFHKNRGKWSSHININGKQIYLGVFVDEELAGLTYQIALKNIDKYDGNDKLFRELLAEDEILKNKFENI